MKNQGFTLLEISISLVIIGLLVGSVLAGRELIRAAEIRNAIRQYEEFNAGVQAFRGKFDCLPGDCTDAANLGFDAGSAGNGDTLIGECSDQTLSASIPCSMGGITSYKEYFYFWYHLSAAGMIKGAIAYNATPTLLETQYMPLGRETPTVKTKALTIPAGTSTIGTSGWGIQGDIVFDAAAGGEALHTHAFAIAPALVAGSLGTVTNTVMGGYKPASLYPFDAKLDDGLPLSGLVRTWKGVTFTGSNKEFVMVGGIGNAGTARCVSNDLGGNFYNISYDGTSSSGLCNLFIFGGF